MNRKARRAAAVKRPVEKIVFWEAFGGFPLMHCTKCGVEMERWIEVGSGRYFCDECAIIYLSKKR